MDNLKFRAWIKAVAVMIRVSEMDFRKNRIKGTDNSGKVYSLRFDEVIIMEYVGVCDEDGNEIYDGDIMEYTQVVSPPIRRVVMRSREPSFHTGFVLSDNAICANGKDVGYWAPVMHVVGNTYENPNLLRFTNERN